ncbi:hypothetical protein TorRG33x02_227750 [Trema orientale]|uniref:Secreted protein n=1 Tax=Trema orientale TaxID=63057 RepID=A0A2P5E7C1_TREOI|nr:hypothetical protein TorRG33x02_227750 [Trema orientale]
MSHLQRSSTRWSTVLLLIALQCWRFSPTRVWPIFPRAGKLLSDIKEQPDMERICRLRWFARAKAETPKSVIVHLETSRSLSKRQLSAIATKLASLICLQPSRFSISRVQPCDLAIAETTLSVRLTQPLRLTFARPASQLSRSEWRPASVIPSSPLKSR